MVWFALGSRVLVRFALFSLLLLSLIIPLFKGAARMSLHFYFSPGGHTHYENSVWRFFVVCFFGDFFFSSLVSAHNPKGLVKQTVGGKENQSDKQTRARAACY